MRAIVVEAFGGPDVMHLREIPDLVTGPGEVLVRTIVAPALRLDALIRSGWQRERFGAAPPYIPGGAATGVVEAVGEGVDASLTGLRVTADRRGRHGGYAEQVVVDADAITPIPDEVTDEVAAALQQDGRTAQLLVDLIEPRAGEWVLVTAAAGGAGHLVVQLARSVGARVIAAAGSDEKRSLVAALGADIVVDYRDPWWVDEVVSATDGNGPAAVFDGAGGALGAAAFVSMADGGRIATYGAPGGTFAQVDAEEATRRGIDLHGLDRVRFRPEEASPLIARALAAASRNELTPHIGAAFPLERAADAHRLIESRAAIGKTLLTLQNH